MIILVIGIVVLAVVVGMTLLGGVEIADPRINTPVDAPLLVELDTIEVPVFPELSPSWSKPQPQDSDEPLWLFGVFTPPKIFIDRDGSFSAQPPAVPTAPDPFGVRFLGLTKKEYRFQFEGYVQEDPLDSKKSLALIFDKSGVDSLTQTIRARIGDALPDKGARIEDIIIKREFNDDGVIMVTERLVIFDERLGESVSLNMGEVKFLDEFTLGFESTITAERVEVESGSPSFLLNGYTYTIDEIVDEGRASVTLTKLTPDDDVLDETETLLSSSIETIQSPGTSPESIGSQQDATQQPESIFNAFDL